jgi:thiaminase/transcriptional activator TenA
LRIHKIRNDRIERDHSFADELRKECNEIWEHELYNHPFVNELSEGILPRKKYELYLVQNHYYLIEYAKCIALAAVRAEDLNTMRQLMKISATTLESELSKFDDFARAFGVKDKALRTVVPLPQNIAYTSYLFKVCTVGSAAEAAAAICPCAWSYIEIGKKIRPALIKSYHMSEKYASFYDSYQTPEYREIVQTIKNIISKGAEESDAGGRDRIKNYFMMSIKFEKMFWDMAYESYT